jgi:hypothetical protein
MHSGAEILPPQGIIRPDFATRSETEKPQVVYYAGQSPKRISLLRMVVEAKGKIFASAPGGPEDNNLNPIQIAIGKIDHAVSFLINNQKIKPNSGSENVFVAADVQIHYPSLKPDGKTVSRTSGKLETPYGVRQLFQGMIESARVRGDKRDYRYLIEAGSASKTMLGLQTIQKTEPPPNFFHIALEEQAVDFFATPSGTELYLNGLNRFLRSPQYLSNGSRHPGSATEICGGLDLAVLEKLGAVRKINQTPRESPDFESESKAALFAAYVGFDISVLEQVNPNAKALIEQWPWLQKVTDYALNG